MDGGTAGADWAGRPAGKPAPKQRGLHRVRVGFAGGYAGSQLCIGGAVQGKADGFAPAIKAAPRSLMPSAKGQRRIAAALFGVTHLERAIPSCCACAGPAFRRAEVGWCAKRGPCSGSCASRFPSAFSSSTCSGDALWLGCWAQQTPVCVAASEHHSGLCTCWQLGAALLLTLLTTPTTTVPSAHAGSWAPQSSLHC